MFRALVSGLSKSLVPPRSLIPQFSSLAATPRPLLDSVEVSATVTRSVTKFSLQSGKRKTVKAVLKRFYRLDWGGWIRTMAGRHKKAWKKSSSRKTRMKQHVLVNATQSTLMDKMVTKYWRKPKYYADDPYEPYHTREEYPYTRRKPLKTN